MDEKLIMKGQIYKITNIKNNLSYVGISFSEKGSYLTRFDLHMSGKGGVWIARDLESGRFSRDDFVIEVLEESDDVDYLSCREIYYIDILETLYPNGYNGNRGKMIVMTEEVIQKAKKTKDDNKAKGKIPKKGTPMQGHACYVYPDGIMKKLPINHPDVLNKVVKHINYNGNPDERKRETEGQREKNGGYTDKQIKAFADPRLKTIHEHDNWKKGRKKFSKRMEEKDFTEKEKDRHSNSSDATTEQWKKVSDENRTKFTKPGQDVMNGRFKCKHCNKITNKGNITRWHNDNCKDK